ncbi:carboxyl transferase domain-containing protein [Lentzea jiangxiensis]|nr:carboxyl transferase domain-containing protein [Lentzea jiangxiensis]
MFSRVAIVNRGEAAMRLIHAVRELAAESGERIETVALYTDVDKSAPFVREADLAYNLGLAADRPYLNLQVLEKALVETKADAAWVGWGFVAEIPEFAELCEKVGVTFVGPSAEAMRKLGDKIGSKLIAEEVGVPVAPWSRGAVENLEHALKVAEEVTYPLMLKATAGGGGRGIRKITCPEEMEENFERTSLEAERAFGSGVMFLERLVTGARHVEVQVIADGQGTAWALGVRDCSVQRRNQKIIEESASCVLEQHQVDELKASAERLANAVGYRGACTVEFLYHPGEKLFAFLEVNTRLQVEHPITEITTGFDLVKAQLHVAGGGKLEGAKPVEQGHAVEARLNAEDPDRDFAPCPGTIVRLELPAGPGIRVDTGVAEGSQIPADFDSMIAKIIAYGRDRDEALGKLRRAMAETTVIIEGGTTNKSFVLDLLDEPAVVDGSADTSWIDRVRADGGLVSHRHSAIALAAAGIEVYEDEEQINRSELLASARGGQPRTNHEGARKLEFVLRGQPYIVNVARVGPAKYRVGVCAADSDAVLTGDVDVERFDHHVGQITVNGTRFRVVTGTHGPVHQVEVDGVTHRVTRDEGGVLRSPMPALVVATPLAVGAEVEAGAPVLVLEAMKMETVLRAPFRARLKELNVVVGTQVPAGGALLKLEEVEDSSGAADVAKPESSVELELPAPRTDVRPEELAARGQDDLRALLLGFDTTAADTDRVLTDYLRARQDLKERPLVAEAQLLGIFADLCDLSRNRPAGEESKPENHIHSPREHFHTYLKTLDADRAALPESFRAKLANVMGHYGITELDRTPQLEQAVFRIFVAQRRGVFDAAVATALLRLWVEEAPPVESERVRVGLVLERIVAATQVRYPAVADLARSVVFTWFAQPLVRRNRARVHSEVRKHLIHLDAHPRAADREDRIVAMVASAEPLVRLLGQRIGKPGADNTPLLEVLARRYYTKKALENPRVSGSFFIAENEPEQTRLISTAVEFPSLTDAIGDVVKHGEGSAVVADLYVNWADGPSDQDEMAAGLGAALAAHQLPPTITRITTTVAGRRGESMHHHFTFRPSSGGFAEERLVRGLHPRIAERMQLERLREFDLTRLSSVDEDVYLFRAVAKANKSDERLVALGQVRDLTPLRDDEGRIVALPAAEDVLATCLDGIRRARAQSGGRTRLATNRVVLYAWPPTDLSSKDLDAIGQRVLPTTTGLDLEEVLFLARRKDPVTGELSDVGVRIAQDAGSGVRFSFVQPQTDPIQPLDDYRQNVLRAQSRGTIYPYELVDMLVGDGGSFVEHDLVDGALVPVDRPRGGNKAGIVVGVVTTPTPAYPEGMKRVVLLGDPTKSLGALAEPECSRVIHALDLASELSVPLEWFSLSSGAKISMSSGVENMDWVAAALKRIVEFTQDGGEINVVVNGINVGAQPYWNAEATMLMHTKGILVMTPDSAMVLTGKQALDFSGGVSAEDNYGIGGYDRVMGPNGQAQYWAPDLRSAFDVLLAHYEHSYIAPGEAGPRRVATSDPASRDVSSYPHVVGDSPFTTVGEIFSTEANPDRKKPFDIRTVMRALSDQDHEVLERWAGMADADTAVVQDVHLGGIPVTLLGVESRGVARTGFPPTDGPDTYTAGTLFPKSSKKAARAINAASGNRPLVVLANLSGFDGSPESMRELQLEYGAEIGRAIVNFRGPIVFTVISRYHGGAFVVFSKALNPSMTVLAVEGSFASVIGGAPAAAVVFAREVDGRTANDPRVKKLESDVAEASGAERAALTAELSSTRQSVRTEKLNEMAAEFDRVHSVQRAVEVGAVDAIITAAELRPAIIKAIEDGLAR